MNSGMSVTISVSGIPATARLAAEADDLLDPPSPPDEESDADLTLVQADDETGPPPPRSGDALETASDLAEDGPPPETGIAGDGTEDADHAPPGSGLTSDPSAMSSIDDLAPPPIDEMEAPGGETGPAAPDAAETPGPKAKPASKKKSPAKSRRK